MGASGWVYVVPFDPDLPTALASLRQKVFDDQDYYFQPGDDGRWPETLEQLWADDNVQEEGSHSILDIYQVIKPTDPDKYGTLRPLRTEELRRYFGTETPNRAIFELAYAADGPSALTT